MECIEALHVYKYPNVRRTLIKINTLKCRRTGLLRPTSGPTGGKRGSPLGGRHKRKPPRGMYINHDDLAAMASGGAGVLMLKAMDRELESLQRQVSIEIKKRKEYVVSCLDAYNPLFCRA